MRRYPQNSFGRLRSRYRASLPQWIIVTSRLSKLRKHRQRRNLRARLRAQMLISAALAVAGLGLAIVGVVAWASPRQEPQLLQRGVAVPIQQTPLFDPGTTVFAAPGPTGLVATPEQLRCEIRSRTTVPLHEKADADHLGSRVGAGTSLVATLTVGATASGAELVCQGKYLESAQVWLMPTLPSMSATPLSVVIGGVGSLGLALLLHPGVRGSRDI